MTTLITGIVLGFMILAALTRSLFPRQQAPFPSEDGDYPDTDEIRKPGRVNDEEVTDEEMLTGADQQSLLNPASDSSNRWDNQ